MTSIFFPGLKTDDAADSNLRPAKPPRRLPFFLRTEIDRLLVAGIFFCCLLVLIRIMHTGTFGFLFIIWNLFLAYVPYAISSWLSAPRTRILHPVIKYAAFIAWLLFLPNTFYILTDLIHLTHYQHPRAPEWFDLALIFSFAWNGLLLGVISLRQMEKYWRPRQNPGGDWRFVYPIMALNALGVYAGRYLRYNSWDILSNPFQLIADIASMIIHPFRNHYAWDMILCYTILLIFIYTMLKKISKAMA